MSSAGLGWHVQSGGLWLEYIDNLKLTLKFGGLLICNFVQKNMDSTISIVFMGRSSNVFMSTFTVHGQLFWENFVLSTF